MIGNRPPEVQLAGSICEDRASPGSVGIRSADAGTQGTSARVIGGDPSAGTAASVSIRHRVPGVPGFGIRHPQRRFQEGRPGMKPRQLCNEAYILRCTSAARSGDAAFVYPRVGCSWQGRSSDSPDNSLEV